MKSVKLNWALSPYLRSYNSSHGGKTLVSLDCFADKDLFAVIKSQWAGYIQKHGKKTALYNIHVIDELIDSGYTVMLDGVNMNKSSSYLSQSIHSNNDWISFLANLEAQNDKWKAQSQQAVEKLKNMFGQGVDETADKTVFGIPHDKLNWTHLKLKSGEPGYEFKIDLQYGIQECMTWEEPSHEYFVPVYYYKTLKPGVSLDELVSLVKKLQALPKAPSFNHEQKWQEGYDSSTWEPKKNDWRWKSSR